MIFFRWEDPFGQPLPEEGRVKVTTETLSILNAQETDSGNYTCLAENIAGVKRASVSVIVSGKYFHSCWYDAGILFPRALPR